MIAPQPFFEPRGTPFSEFHRIRAMTALGHQVDLVTYPFGDDVEMPGLRIFRCARPPFVRRVKIGPSLAKIPLDLQLMMTALGRVWRTGTTLSTRTRKAGSSAWCSPRRCGCRICTTCTPACRSSSPISPSAARRLVRRVFLGIERLMIRRSRVVIVICPSLEETVRAIDPAAQVILIENAPGSGEGAATAAQAAAVREAFGLGASTPVVLYTGTFEAYQGLDLLFAAMALVRSRRPDARLLLAGGKPDQVRRAQEQAQAAGIGDVTLFAGERPASEIPAYLLAADVLVSPRSRGTNTPLKIYQYLRSAKAIVATRLLTHTQVLDDDTAFLTGVSAAEFADGILAALENPDARRRRRTSRP